MARKNSSKRTKSSNSTHNSYIGILDITRSGMGYVIVEKLHRDILVKPTEINRAFHGDKVRVNIIR